MLEEDIADVVMDNNKFRDVEDDFDEIES